MIIHSCGAPNRSCYISHLCYCKVFQLPHISAAPHLLQSAQPDLLLPFTARVKASVSARWVCQHSLPNDYYRQFLILWRLRCIWCNIKNKVKNHKGPEITRNVKMIGPKNPCVHMAESYTLEVKARQYNLHDSKSISNIKCLCLFVFSLSLTWVNLLMFALIVFCRIYQQWIKD